MITVCFHTINIEEELSAEVLLVRKRHYPFNSPTTEPEYTVKFPTKLIICLLCHHPLQADASLDVSQMPGAVKGCIAIFNIRLKIPSHTVMDLFKPYEAISYQGVATLSLCQVYETMLVVLFWLVVEAAAIEEQFVWHKVSLATVSSSSTKFAL